ncbi:hypothetical protein P3L10_020962 [Capsicum annuum]
MTSSERSEIYLSCQRYCIGLMITVFAFILLNIYTARWVITMHNVQALFMGCLVLFSKEILYEANFGDINFVNCTFTVFFNLPAIVIHTARVYLQGAEIEQDGQD